jgi:hypothetical protein
MSSDPSISARVSTSASILDLSLDIPFTITVIVVLDSIEPITIHKPSTPLFRRLLYNDGLTFTNTKTGERTKRPKMACSWEHGVELPRLPSDKDKDRWLTLVPEQPHQLQITLKPQLAGQPIPSTTIEEMKRIQAQQIKTRQWPLVRSLEDGQTYKLGISEATEVQEWLKGSLGDILKMGKAEATRTVQVGTIRFKLEETTSFEMKRPDNDGSMDLRGGL